VNCAAPAPLTRSTALSNHSLNFRFSHPKGIAAKKSNTPTAHICSMPFRGGPAVNSSATVAKTNTTTQRKPAVRLIARADFIAEVILLHAA
jgi:hypothetical protein